MKVNPFARMVNKTIASVAKPVKAAKAPKVPTARERIADTLQKVKR